MAKKSLIFLFSFLITTSAYAASGGTTDYQNPPLNIREIDGSPSTYPYSVKVSNGTLTDNGDGTVTLTTGGGGTVYNLNNLTGYSTTNILEVGGLGTSGTVSASTISGNTISTGSYTFPVDSGSGFEQALTISGNTVSWKAPYQTVYNVKEFGAKGDGVTDDTIAIQNTINAAGIVHGKVYLPTGDYKITSELTVTLGQDGISIVGDSMYSSRLIGSGAITVLSLTGVFFCSVEDLYITGSTATCGIKINTGGYDSLKNIEVYHLNGLNSIGVYLLDPSMVFCENVSSEYNSATSTAIQIESNTLNTGVFSFQGCKIGDGNGGTKYGLKIVSTANVVDSVFFGGTYFSGTDAAVYLSSGREISFIGCHFENITDNKDFVLFDGGALDISFRDCAFVANNTIDNGLRFANTSTVIGVDLRNLEFTNLNNSASCVKVDSGASVSSATYYALNLVSTSPTLINDSGQFKQFVLQYDSPIFNGITVNSSNLVLDSTTGTVSASTISGNSVIAHDIASDTATITDKISAGYGTENNNIIGNANIGGFTGGPTGYAVFGAMTNTTKNFALAQQYLGLTKVNAPLGSDVYLSIDGNPVMTIEDNRIIASQTIEGTTVSGNTISGNTINSAGAFTLPNYDGSNGQIMKTNGSGVLTWSADNNSGGTATTLDNLNGYSTTKVLEVGGLGTSGTVSASTVQVYGTNSSAIRIFGTDSANEIGDMWIGANGAFNISTVNGNDPGRQINLLSQDDEYGTMIWQSSGGAPAVFANLYMNDAATDYLNIVLNATDATLGLVIQDGANVGVGMIPTTKLEVLGTISGNTVQGTFLNATNSVSSDTVASNSLNLNNSVLPVGTYKGTIIQFTANEAQGIGDVVAVSGSTVKAYIAKADVIANASGVLVAVSSAGAGTLNNYLLPGGVIRLSSSPSWTVGGLVFLSTTGTTGNTLTQTAPSGANNVIQVLGVAISQDTLLFEPSLSQVEHV